MDGDDSGSAACDKGAFELVGTLPPVGGDVMLPGNRIRLADTSGSAGRRTFAGMGRSADAVSVPDPTLTGATVRIGRVGGPVTVLDLPASGWVRTGGTDRVYYKYKSRTGPTVAAKVVQGRSVSFSAFGAGGYPLGGTPQGGVGVIIQVGNTRFCGFFGGVMRKDDGKRFLAGKAPAPAVFPTL